MKAVRRQKSALTNNRRSGHERHVLVTSPAAICAIVPIGIGARACGPGIAVNEGRVAAEDVAKRLRRSGCDRLVTVSAAP